MEQLPVYIFKLIAILPVLKPTPTITFLFFVLYPLAFASTNIISSFNHFISIHKSSLPDVSLKIFIVLHGLEVPQTPQVGNI